MSEKKHLSFQISAEFHELLRELAEHDNTSISQLVRDLLEKLEPGLRQARDMMVAAKNMSEEARKIMMPEIIRHGENLESNVKYGMENIERELMKGKVQKGENSKDQEPPQHKLPL